MALGRTYTVSTGPGTVAATASTPILLGATGATVTADIQALRIGVYSGSGVSYPANATVSALLARPSNTPSVGPATTVTPAPHNPSDIAANSTWSIGAFLGGTAWTTAPTAPAAGAAGWLWSEPVPFAAGAGWGEWVNPGAEWRVPASGYIAVFILCSAAGTATQFQAELVFVE